MMARVSLASPFSVRVQELLKIFSRTARLVSDVSTGCCVVFCSGMTNLPGILRSSAPLAAAAISSSLKPARSALLPVTNAPAFGAGQKLLLEIGRERRILLVDLAQLLLVGFRQVGTGMNELQIVDLQQLRGFRIQLQAVALVIDRLHAREELVIEEDRVVVRRELRRLVGLDLVQRVVGVRLDDAEESRSGAVEQTARLLHRDDGVLEGRRFGIVRDRLDLGDLLAHAFFDRGLIVAVLDAVERRRVKRQIAHRGERIGWGKRRRSLSRGRRRGGCGL